MQRVPGLRLARLADVLRQVPVPEDVPRDRHEELGAGLRAAGTGAAPLARRGRRRRRPAGPGALEALRPDGSRGVRVVASGEYVCRHFPGKAFLSQFVRVIQ